MEFPIFTLFVVFSKTIHYEMQRSEYVQTYEWCQALLAKRAVYFSLVIYYILKQKNVLAHRNKWFP